MRRICSCIKNCLAFVVTFKNSVGVDVTLGVFSRFSWMRSENRVFLFSACCLPSFFLIEEETGLNRDAKHPCQPQIHKSQVLPKTGRPRPPPSSRQHLNSRTLPHLLPTPISPEGPLMGTWIPDSTTLRGETWSIARASCQGR